MAKKILWGGLSAVSIFFLHQQILEEEKVSLASFHMEGTIQLYFLQMLQDTYDPSWEDFKHQCHLHFGPFIRSNKFGELAKLKQVGKVAEYQAKFENLISSSGLITQNKKFSFFLVGYKSIFRLKLSSISI